MTTHTGTARPTRQMEEEMAQLEFGYGDTVSAIRAVPHPTKRREYVGERQIGVVDGFAAGEVFVRWTDGSGAWQSASLLRDARAGI